MAGLVTALDNLQRTPVLQRIKELTLRYQENAAAKGSPKDNLAIQMTMEAMIVAGTKPNFEPALKPDTGLQLPSAAHPRRYADIAKKNIFIGLVPYREPPEDSIGFRMAEFVMLDQVDAASKEAYLRFQLTQTKDMRLKPMAGFDTILVMSEDGSKELVRGKVLRVDQPRRSISRSRMTCMRSTSANPLARPWATALFPKRSWKTFSSPTWFKNTIPRMRLREKEIPRKGTKRGRSGDLDLPPAALPRSPILTVLIKNS